MTQEKTTVKGLHKAVQSTYDKLDLRIRDIEEQAKIVEKQRRCEHYWITVGIGKDGYIGRVRCNECGKNLHNASGKKNWYNRVLKKLHKYLIEKG